MDSDLSESEGPPPPARRGWSGVRASIDTSDPANLHDKTGLLRYIHNLNKAQGRDYQIIESRPRYFKVNCSSAPIAHFLGKAQHCQFCVFAKALLDENRIPTNTWVIYKENENHTCNHRDGKRKAHEARYLQVISRPLQQFVPNIAARNGAVKQITRIARVSEGLSMKRTQALNLIQKKSNDEMHVHIGQYLLLQSYFNLLQDQDPNGTFELESIACDWKESDPFCQTYMQFDRSYTAFSFAKNIWIHNGIQVLVADGTFTTTGKFRHTILLAITKDGNNNLVLLAYCVCDGEDAANWIYFMNNLQQDFPDIVVFMSDYDKGVESAAFQNILEENDIGFARCVRHMIGNCSKSVQCTMNEKTKALIYKLARARTQESYTVHLNKLCATNAELAEWWHTRRGQFATYLLLQNGFSRFGNILNNMAEQFNSIIREIRGRPILDLMIQLNEYQIAQYTKRVEMWTRWVEENKVLTPYAWEQHLDMSKRANELHYAPNPSRGNVYCGVINTDSMQDSTQTIFASVNSETFQQQCPCEYNEEHARPCVHTWNVIKHNCPDIPLTRWYGRVFHVSEYKMAYEADVPDISTKGKLFGAGLLPPQETSMRGRPKKKRYQSTSNNPKQCKACGNYGHTQQTCRTPSTEVRVNFYWGKAIEYVKAIQFGSKED